MARCAAAAVVVLAVFYATPTLGRPDDALALEVEYHATQQENTSAATATTSLNETRYAAAVKTPTSVSSQPIPPTEITSNTTDINDPVLEDDLYLEQNVERFFNINARAARDPVFQRRQVQVLSCCFAEDADDVCLAECVNHFVKSVDSGIVVANATKSLLLCSALYDLLKCQQNNKSQFADACMEYCRCYSSDPWVEAVWGLMTALFFVCMLLTLAAYACVPRLRNLHGKCLLSYLVAVITGEAIATVSVSVVCGDPYPVAAGVVYYLTLVRYCWVNLLCLDVYFTCQPFQSVRQQPRTGSFSLERRKFLCFSVAAWGGSALVHGLLMAIQMESKQIIYTGIVLLLLVSSCIPLMLTLVRIWRTKSQIKKKCLNISKVKVNWFYLTSKLLCLSGVGRLISVVLYLTVRGKPYYSWLYVVLKLEGPIMLFLFVWNVRVRGLVRERLSTLEWISVEKGINT